MNTCPHCHIRVGGDTAYCPLCQNRLSGPAGEPYFPATAPRIHRASLLYKIVAFVLSALIVVAGAFDFLLMEDTPHRHFSILMAVWAVALVYLLMNIGIGVLPYILLFFRIDYSGRLDAHSLPWVICLIISVITFLGLVIFRGRALKNEIVKRLHM